MKSDGFPRMSADEAAAHVSHGDTVGFSGFTPAGAAKVVPTAIAKRAEEFHRRGEPFQIGVLTGASTGPSLDGALARADAISFRTPYQANPDLRQRINAGQTKFFDMHLSMLPQSVRYGVFGAMRWAIVEACDISADGEIVLTSSVGASPTFCAVADKIIVELNAFHPAALRGIHDIYQPLDPPQRREIPVFRPSDRIGSSVIKVDPRKIFCVVESNQADETKSFDEASETTRRIGEHVAEFLVGELRARRIPQGFLPLQSGVGDIANAVLSAMGSHSEIPAFEMYTEVAQDAVIRLMRQERIRFVSSCAVTVSKPTLLEVYRDLDWFRQRLVLRPQEISNNPEVIRRLGVISINTAVEADVFGNVNSTHILGRNLVNGIGGSGDFTRNAFLSIFTCPSIQKGGKISTLVPLVSHADHSEHSVQVIITEQGVADLRGKDPRERAKLIVERCVHPDYRDDLRRYLASSLETHTPQVLRAAFAMHERFAVTGDMHGVPWSDYLD